MLVLTDLVNSAITGIFVGLGSTIGTWLATRHMIRYIEHFEEKISKQKEETPNC